MDGKSTHRRASIYTGERGYTSTSVSRTGFETKDGAVSGTDLIETEGSEGNITAATLAGT